MPPLRRYLRLSHHSVLESRIYLDNPADATRWLLYPRAPALPRVIQAVRPLVLPMLKEERAAGAKSGGGGKRKRAGREVVGGDDFEVSVFLTAGGARHSVLRKEKRVKSERARLGSTERRMTGVGTREEPMDVGGGDEGVVVREEGQEGEVMRVGDIPHLGDEGSSRGERDGSEEGLFLSEGSEDEGAEFRQRSFGKGKQKEGVERQVDADDKKKMAFSTTYDGFSIHGQILCLVVKRKGNGKGKELVGGAGQAMMEDWIASTQIAEGQMMDE